MSRDTHRLATALTVALVTVALVSAAAVPSLAAVTTQDNGEYEVADGRTGSVDPGREDNEEQVYPINLTYHPLDHTPGATGVSYELYASGLVENGTLHGLRLQSPDFNYADCTPSDTGAFGIDRGNDDSGTTVEKSLLTAYKTYSSSKNTIDLAFYKEQQIAGEPVNGSVYDQLVARQNGCIDNPDEPGWYRVDGRLNGSTKFDTTTDATIRAGSQYTYICDCANEQQARETLGPPPNEQGDGGDGTSTPESTATPTPTATTATPTPGTTPTATAAGGTPATTTQTTAGTPTETVTTTGGGPTASPAGTATGTRSTGTTTPGGNPGGNTTPSPTLTEGGGPGLGLGVALVALTGAALLALRRRG